MEIQGKLVNIEAEKQVTEKFKKREFWIEIEGERPQTIALEFVQGNCEKLDAFQIGDKAVAKFSLMGRVFKETKCFNTLQAYSLERIGGAVREMAPKEDEGDLPF